MIAAAVIAAAVLSQLAIAAAISHALRNFDPEPPTVEPLNREPLNPERNP